MKMYLETMGVEEIWYLVGEEDKGDGDETVGTRGRAVARRMRDWTSHPFWAGLQDRI
jgi:hypothetical protein